MARIVVAQGGFDLGQVGQASIGGGSPMRNEAFSRKRPTRGSHMAANRDGTTGPRLAAIGWLRSPRNISS